MKTHLMAAIEERKLLRMLYEDEIRTVEPHALGRNILGDDIVLCRQVSPMAGEDGFWQVFKLAKIYELTVLTDEFERPDEFLVVPRTLLSGVRLML